MDKIKGAFNKKEKGPGVERVKSPEGRAVQFEGIGKVADALRFAADKIDTEVAAKKYDDKRANMFMAQLKGVESSTVDEDAKLVQISQIIGEIVIG